MAGNSVVGLLTEVDNLFTTQAERETGREAVIHLPLAEISDFPNHPFKLRIDKAMEKLANSVKERGVLLPGLVRPLPGGDYQMISGHRRKWASEMAETGADPGGGEVALVRPRPKRILCYSVCDG